MGARRGRDAGGARSRGQAPGSARRSLLFLPFWLDFDPPTTSIGRIEEHVEFSRFVRDYVYIYGLALWVVLALFASRFRISRKHAAWAGSVLLFCLVLLAPSRLSGLTVALLVAAAAAFVTLATGRLTQPYRVLWLLTAVALALLASGEVVYLRDAFDGTDSFRFNTVFKTGYQAWFLLSIVAGVGVYWSARWLGRRARAVWLAGLAALVALALVYPIAASYSKSGRFDASPTLDGMRWLEQRGAGRRGRDRLAARLGRRLADAARGGRERLRSRRAAVGSRRSRACPTVMGWAGHEVQWGHDPGSRFGDVQPIYSTEDLGRRARAPRAATASSTSSSAIARADATTRPPGSRSSSGSAPWRSGRARPSSTELAISPTRPRRRPRPRRGRSRTPGLRYASVQ